MGFVRVVAVSKEEGQEDRNYKIIILCKIDGSGRLSDGEWFGYMKNEEEEYPFILRSRDRLVYGWEEHEYEPTNLGSREVAEGSYFAVFNQPGASEQFEAPYQIVSVHKIEN